MRTITIKDESLAGDILNEIKVKFQSEYITVAELIIERVNVEIEKYKNNVTEFRKGLVQPSEFEQRINKTKESKKLEIDVEKQVYTALEAFQQNAFFIIIDDQQVETLEQKFLVEKDTRVSFVKLTPLVGG